MADRTHRTLDDADVARIAGNYHDWRGDGSEEYADEPGFCRAAPLAEVAAHGYVLTPGRYVGVEAQEANDESFAVKLARLTETLNEQFEASDTLERVIQANLRTLSHAE